VDARNALDAWEITPLERDGTRHQVIIVLPASVSARYDTIEIEDDTNAAGYVEVGYVWIGDVFEPTYNAAYGLRDEIESLSTADRSESGAMWASRRRTLRGVSFVLEWLTLTEGDTLHELQRVVGTTEPVLYLPDLNDRATQQRYGYAGTLTDLSAVEYPYWSTRRLPLRIKELA
jgi:hypothetical protein